MKRVVTEEVISHLEKIDIEEIIDQHRYDAYEQLKIKTFVDFEDSISGQMQTVEKTKRLMINLFVAFNFFVICAYILASFSLSEKAILGIVSLYISLSAFIVYIYRTSNARSRLLLALREDSKKIFDVQDYLQKIKHEKSITNVDVEVLRLLMTNHSEREKAIEHPYELILKGVTNSNIQFKGGNMALKSAKE